MTPARTADVRACAHVWMLRARALAKTPQKSVAPMKDGVHSTCTCVNGRHSADSSATTHSCTATSACTPSFVAKRSVKEMWKAYATEHPNVSQSPEDSPAEPTSAPVR